jgi:hypothetical protein
VYADLNVQQAKITLDEQWSPYCQARLTVTRPKAAVLEWLDPRNNARVALRLRAEYADYRPIAVLSSLWGGKPISALTVAYSGKPGGEITDDISPSLTPGVTRGASTRDFDLYVRSIDPRSDGRMELTLASGEAKLHDKGNVALTRTFPAGTDLAYMIGVDLSLAARVMPYLGAELHTHGEDPYYLPEPARFDFGQKFWPFWAPLVQQAGRRLWCDELGEWHLTAAPLDIDPLDLLEGGLTEVAQHLSLEEDEWADAVAITYRWRDDSDTEQVRTDSATSTSLASAHLKLLALEYNVPYPGPGAAAHVLARRMLRGRVIGPKAVSQYDVTPTQPLNYYALDGELITGAISAVEWTFPEHTMTIRARDLEQE